jgi:hypothetical protein
MLACKVIVQYSGKVSNLCQAWRHLVTSISSMLLSLGVEGASLALGEAALPRRVTLEHEAQPQ